MKLTVNTQASQVGATIHGVYGGYSQFLDNGYLSTSAFLVAIGMIIFIISFFGCCGAVKENFCMIITFTTLLILIFIFELAAGISGYVLRDGVSDMLVNNLNQTMQHYNNNTEDTRTFDILQSTFECCGVVNYTDWFNKFDKNEVPVSCCAHVYGAVFTMNCTTDMPEFHHTPCVDAFGQFIRDHAVTLGGVGIGLAFVQLIGIVFSCNLSKQIKLNYNSV
ncbi:Tetraspanin 29Fa [Carabus blaptoides fortunei]